MKKHLRHFILIATFFSGQVWGDVIIIVHQSNPVTRLSPFQLSEMFLKKNRTWPDGQPVRFFDRSDNSEERKTFLNNILNRSSREIDQYWIGQKLYTGNSAPSQIPTDGMTISMVSRFPGAIGYINSDSFVEGKGIKKIEVLR